MRNRATHSNKGQRDNRGLQYTEDNERTGNRRENILKPKEREKKSVWASLSFLEDVSVLQN